VRRRPAGPASQGAAPDPRCPDRQSRRCQDRCRPQAGPGGRHQQRRPTDRADRRLLRQPGDQDPDAGEPPPSRAGPACRGLRNAGGRARPGHEPRGRASGAERKADLPRRHRGVVLRRRESNLPRGGHGRGRLFQVEDFGQAGDGLSPGRRQVDERGRRDAAVPGTARAGADDSLPQARRLRPRRVRGRPGARRPLHVVADEERKIRTNPAARTTDLLREVFSKWRSARGAQTTHTCAIRWSRRPVDATTANQSARTAQKYVDPVSSVARPLG
jgi:hypothetical protein